MLGFGVIRPESAASARAAAQGPVVDCMDQRGHEVDQMERFRQTIRALIRWHRRKPPWPTLRAARSTQQMIDAGVRICELPPWHMSWKGEGSRLTSDSDKRCRVSLQLPSVPSIIHAHDLVPRRTYDQIGTTASDSRAECTDSMSLSSDGMHAASHGHIGPHSPPRRLRLCWLQPTHPT